MISYPADSSTTDNGREVTQYLFFVQHSDTVRQVLVTPLASLRRRVMIHVVLEQPVAVESTNQLIMGKKRTLLGSLGGVVKARHGSANSTKIAFLRFEILADFQCFIE